MNFLSADGSLHALSRGSLAKEMSPDFSPKILHVLSQVSFAHGLGEPRPVSPACLSLQVPLAMAPWSGR